jgi:F0F1-type ATP synthase assembly protein I
MTDDQAEKSNANPWREPLMVFGKISGWIAGPVILALFAGRYLDERFQSAPWWFLGMTAFAFLISCYGIYRETAAYMKSIEDKHGTTPNNNTTTK